MKTFKPFIVWYHCDEKIDLLRYYFIDIFPYHAWLQKHALGCHRVLSSHPSCLFATSPQWQQTCHTLPPQQLLNSHFAPKFSNGQSIWLEYTRIKTPHPQSIKYYLKNSNWQYFVIYVAIIFIFTSHLTRYRKISILFYLYREWTKSVHFKCCEFLFMSNKTQHWCQFKGWTNTSLPEHKYF